jgi:hypothetical protein
MNRSEIVSSSNTTGAQLQIVESVRSLQQAIGNLPTQLAQEREALQSAMTAAQSEFGRQREQFQTTLGALPSQLQGEMTQQIAALRTAMEAFQLQLALVPAQTARATSEVLTPLRRVQENAAQMAKDIDAITTAQLAMINRAQEDIWSESETIREGYRQIQEELNSTIRQGYSQSRQELAKTATSLQPIAGNLSTAADRVQRATEAAEAKIWARSWSLPGFPARMAVAGLISLLAGLIAATGILIGGSHWGAFQLNSGAPRTQFTSQEVELIQRGQAFNLALHTAGPTTRAFLQRTLSTLAPPPAAKPKPTKSKTAHPASSKAKR